MPERRLLNKTAEPTLEIDCSCKTGSATTGRPNCDKCNGTGVRRVRSCKRCGGTGSDSRMRDVPPPCVDCKRLGWRTMDNEIEHITSEIH